MPAKPLVEDCIFCCKSKIKDKPCTDCKTESLAHLSLMVRQTKALEKIAYQLEKR